MNYSIKIESFDKKHKTACLTAFESNVPKFFTAEELGQFAYFLDHFEDNIYPNSNQRRTYFYVLLNDGELIGCGGFGDKDGNQRITLAWGLIHSDFHRKSFGSTLLKFRLEAIKKHFPRADVYLDTTQHSSPFYEKLGFQLKNVTSDFFEIGMHKHELIYQASGNNS